MARRVQRKKLAVPDSGKLLELPPSDRLLVVVEYGKHIDLSYLSTLDNARIVVHELNIFLRGQTAKRAVANQILQYLRFLVTTKCSVSSETLQLYRQELDRDNSIKLNTKYQKFVSACTFVRHLMASDVVVQSDLPKPFNHEERTPKATFVDAVRYDLASILAENEIDVVQAMDRYHLDKLGAQGLVFGELCMRAIETAASQQCEKSIKDWEYVDERIATLDEARLRRLKNIRDFSAIGNERTVNTAIEMLYSHYGRALPPSTDWPSGISDYCKYRGWTPDRIRGAFFPTVKTLDCFLVLALSNRDLLPNVDSVAFYAYTDCCKPAFEKGTTAVHFGKKRGSPSSAVLGNKEPLVVALSALSKRIRLLLPMMPNGAEWLHEEMLPIFLHYTHAAGSCAGVKTVDRSTTRMMVRRFIQRATEAYPVLKPLVGKINGENFRPTHIYLRKLSGQRDYEIMQAANHKHLRTTVSYGQSIEVQAIQNRKHRDYQRFLIDTAQASGAKRTGSGYICGSDKAEDNDCSDYEFCHLCDAKRIVFESPEITAEWVAWEELLCKEQARLQMNNQARWQAVWAPKLVECQAFIAHTSARTLTAARKLATSLVLPPLG